MMPDYLGGHMPTLEQIKAFRLHLLTIIVERGKAKPIIQMFGDKKVHFQYTCMAEGTASSELMDLLGLGSIDKTVVFCLAADFMIPELLTSLKQRFELAKAGKGIAFTIPLSGINAAAVRLLSQEVQEEWQKEMEQEVDKMSSAITHDLIIAVINQGFSEELMTAAKAAGATGGTVFHARRTGTEHANKFFGISIQAEKEIVAILSSRENKQAIMSAISKAYGLKTEANGIVISLPVDSVAGLES